jgi:hypothetical protein
MIDDGFSNNLARRRKILCFKIDVCEKGKVLA